MWIADISDDVIHGTDFLEPHGCQINFQDSKVLIGSDEIPFAKSCLKPNLFCCRVLLKECVDIPPCSEMVVMAKMDGSMGRAKWGLVEAGTATSRAADGVLIGRTLINLEEEVLLHLMNLANLPHRVKSSLSVNQCVEGVSTIDDSSGSAACIRRAQVEFFPAIYKSSMNGA